MNEIYEKISDFIDKNGLINNGDSILISVSAGKDSVFILHYLKYIQSRKNLKLYAFHLNHLLRGTESDKDVEFIAEICSKMGIRLFQECFDFRRIKSNFENCARNKRYEMLEKIRETNSINKIATAHTMSDDVETILYRLFRGTSIHGLKGIMPLRYPYIRPLLCITKEEVIDFLVSENISWREDRSNLDNSYDRNFIRNSIMPLVESRFCVNQSLISLKKSAEDAENVIKGIYENLVISEVTNESVKIKISDLIYEKAYYNYTISGIIRDFLKNDVTNGMLSESYRNILRSKNKTNLTLYCGEKLRIFKKHEAGMNFLVLTRRKLEDVPFWEIRIDTANATPCDEIPYFFSFLEMYFVSFQKYTENSNKDIIFINADRTDCLKIRQKTDGDRILLDGKNVRLKKMMINSKLTVTEKLILPVLETRGIILGAIFRAVSESHNRVNDDFKVTSDTKKILAIYCNCKIM